MPSEMMPCFTITLAVMVAVYFAARGLFALRRTIKARRKRTVPRKIRRLARAGDTRAAVEHMLRSEVWRPDFVSFAFSGDVRDLEFAESKPLEEAETLKQLISELVAAEPRLGQPVELGDVIRSIDGRVDAVISGVEEPNPGLASAIDKVVMLKAQWEQYLHDEAADRNVRVLLRQQCEASRFGKLVLRFLGFLEAERGFELVAARIRDARIKSDPEVFVMFRDEGRAVVVVAPGWRNPVDVWLTDLDGHWALIDEIIEALEMDAETYWKDRVVDTAALESIRVGRETIVRLEGAGSLLSKKLNDAFRVLPEARSHAG